MTAGAPSTCTAAVAGDDVLSVDPTLLARSLYRHFPGLEVFVDFDKEDVLHSPCNQRVWISTMKSKLDRDN